MSRRPALVLLLAAALLAPGSVASAAPKVTTLVGTVRIFATQSVVLDVRLPKPVNLGDGYKMPLGTGITGAGRTIGALLEKSDFSLTSYEVVRYNFCKGVGCTTKYTRLWYHGQDEKPEVGNEILPAGDYRLAIVTDGKPVVVQLVFPGLRGRMDLRPTRPLYVKHQQTSFLGATGNIVPGTFYSGAADIDVDGGTGIVLHQMLVQTEATLQQDGGFCTYSGPVKTEPAPNCPGGNGAEISITQVKLDPSNWAMSGRWKYVPEGEHRAGGYYRTTGYAYDPVGTITTVIIPAKQK